jgi:hypothetical protein
MAEVHDREKTLEQEIVRTIESGMPGVEVLAVELSGPERFTVFVDHPQGVDHALCARVTDHLRGYLDRYTVDVSSPGLERPRRISRTPSAARSRSGRPTRSTGAGGSAARSRTPASAGSPSGRPTNPISPSRTT